jgi:CheY-like chemotaxis protein
MYGTSVVPSSESSAQGEPRLRVLVAEDAQCVKMKLGWLMSKIHVDVDMADNGQTAGEMAGKSRATGKPYDLILMDIQMPVMNGEDATRWLRQHGWQGPILAVTALVENSDTELFLKSGCDGCIAKPITEAVLRDVLAHYAKRK